MSEKAMDVYQGDDWFTDRWSVAQVFDTLDRMREVCGHVTMPVADPARVAGASTPRYAAPEDEIMDDLFGCLIGLCDDLSGELDAVLADLVPPPQAAPPQRWVGFEMQLHLNLIRHQAIEAKYDAEPPTASMDAIAALINRMRDLLKKIDQ